MDALILCISLWSGASRSMTCNKVSQLEAAEAWRECAAQGAKSCRAGWFGSTVLLNVYHRSKKGVWT